MNKVVNRLQVVSIGVVTCVLLSAANSGAVPITGEIHFGGQFTPIDNIGAAAPLSTATGIEFVNPSTVLAATGDFAAFVVPNISLATFVSSFQFNPLSPSPVSPLWSAGGFTFTLTAVNVTLQSGDQLALLGTGHIAGNGFETTVGSWNFTGQGSGLFTFSADNVASRVTVPDGGNTVMLLGFALMGLGAIAAGMRKTTVA